jgi:organic hydroperoxide reductase OsmC/OhrA
MKTHTYDVNLTWTGNSGAGTRTIRGYGREHEISAAGKAVIAGSSDPSFRGNAERWNPEELLVASLCACHQLWYLALCAQAGVTVVSYEDKAQGRMVEESDGGGQFAAVVLHPKVVIDSSSDPGVALHLHHRAHQLCFIARSVNFPVTHEPEVVVAP